MTETPSRRRGHREGARPRGRVRKALSEAPLWVRQASAFIVGAAGVAVAVATIVGLLGSSPPGPLDVKLGRPEWAAHDLTLGGYLAWQQRESANLGLRPSGESAAAALGGDAGGSGAKWAVLSLAHYVSAGREDEAQLKAASTLDTPRTPGATATLEAGEPGTGDTSTGPEPGSSTPKSGSTSPPSTGPGDETNPAEPAGGGTAKSGVKGALSSDVLREAQSHLTSLEKSRLQQKASTQEALIKEAGAGSGATLARECQGAGYGGCSPEAVGESVAPPPTGESSYSEEGTGGPAQGGTTTSSPPSALGQRQRELLEIAGGARLGRATDVDLIPPLMTTGLSSEQRARVSAVLGDAVSFDVHTHGWIGQQLWLTWTMYEKQDGFWNPSSREYLIDHAEAYVVPTAIEDEGILTFWFPIPKQRGDYQVHYFIRAPGSGKKLVAGKSPSFRS